MLKIHAYSVSFAAMIRKHYPPLWLVMHHYLHYDRYKWCRIVIMRPEYMGICLYLGVHI